MTSRPRLLLVDDDETIRANLGPFLQRSGFEVATAVDGVDALTQLGERRPDLVVLDVMLPQLDGREVLRRIRAGDSWLPVILLTNVGESFERAAALEEGADDYLNKPFDPQELVARVRAVLRRAVAGTPPLSSSSTLTSGLLRIDRVARRTWVAQRELTLTPKAFSLLEYLMGHPDEVFTRERLLQTVWGYDAIVTSRAVDHRIAELRRVLGDDAGDPDFVETVSGIGYRFVGSVERA